MLLLNIPPNNDGLLEDKDIGSIKEFRSILDETFAVNLLNDKVNKQLTDKALKTYITMKENVPLIIDFKKEMSFDRAMLQENIANGQTIEEGKLEYWDGNKWLLINTFSTVGYKRLLRFEAVRASQIRLTILKSKGSVQLAEAGLFKASSRELSGQ